MTAFTCDDDVLQCHVPFGQSQHFTQWAASKEVRQIGPRGHFCPYGASSSRHGKGPEKGYKDPQMAGAPPQAETVGTVQPREQKAMGGSRCSL